jgi:hypothetical protein
VLYNRNVACCATLSEIFRGMILIIRFLLVLTRSKAIVTDESWDDEVLASQCDTTQPHFLAMLGPTKSLLSYIESGYDTK